MMARTRDATEIPAPAIVRGIAPFRSAEALRSAGYLLAGARRGEGGRRAA
jgi:hypothetical protein